MTDIALAIVALAVFVVAVIVRIDTLRMEQQRKSLEQMLAHVSTFATAKPRDEQGDEP